MANVSGAVQIETEIKHGLSIPFQSVAGEQSIDVGTLLLETMKAETITRRVSFAILTAVCVLTGIFWPQVKKIWPPFTEAATSTGTNPVAWFVVLMFILAVFAFHRPRSRNREEILSPRTPPRSELDHSPPVERIFIDESPTYLIELYKNRTSIQGNALAAAYLNKWVTVTGNVADIDEIFDGGLLVIILSNDKIVSAHFPKKEREKISHVAHGTTITIHGELQRINDHSITLCNCEIAS